ncbi:MAG TPA: glycosyl hydrolase family 18 protein [Candidatus Limnocylindrales bacterium]|nr:glycosyl hydrolase family 18 protein [Candidatus Limnocylindrales bacterium]
MPDPTRHQAARPRRLALLVAAIAALLSSQATAAVGTAAASPATTVPGLAPTIHWQEAEAHAQDRIDFRPGGRVTIGFTPRGSDRWSVGGGKARALPAGRLDGRAMRAQRADGPAIGPNVDRPTVDPAALVSAVPASWSAPEPSGDRDLQAPVDPGALRREVFGFLPYWEVNSSTLSLQWDKISTVAYFGVGADANGNLQKRNSDGTLTTGWAGWTSSGMTSIISAAHRTGTRVVLTVQSFAWNATGKTRQATLLNSSTHRLNLARQIAAAVRDRGADGVNLDLEPLVSGSEAGFTALVRTIRAELDKVARGYQLTFDTTGSIGNYPIEDATATGGADAIFIMGYDYRGAASSPVGSVAPLSRSGYDIRDTVAAYTARVARSKLILGVPYYGRAWSTDTNLVHAKNISGAKYGSSTTVVYTSALPFFTSYGKAYESTEQVAWTAYRRQNCTTTYGCVTSWRQLYIDDARAVAAKYDLINQYGLRGSGIWALGYDGTRTELWAAIGDAFITDTVPPSITGGSLSAPYFSPNGDGVLDVTTARITVTGLTTWGYRVQPYSGTTLLANIRSGSRTGKSPAMTWNGFDAGGAVAPDGRYRITLWAEDISGNHSERGFDVVVDTRPASVATSAGYGFVTPDGDGRTDTIPLRWSSNEPFGGKVRVLDAGGTMVRGWSFTPRTSLALTWDGRRPDGTIVNDGRYTFSVDGRDRAGNRTTANRTILVDRTIKSVRWSDPSFDPRAGQRSTASIVLRRAAVLDVGIYRGNTLVRNIWTGRSVAGGTTTYTWNGRTASGAYLAAGTYRIRVSARSWIGTTTYSQNVVIEVH